MGRPHALTAHQRTEALRALAEGSATQADLARRFAVSQSTISRLADAATPTPSRPAIDLQTERAARAFLSRIEERYAVKECILYGSRARGDHGPDSDADLAVVLHGAAGDRTATSLDMAGVAFDVLLETGVRVQGLPLWEDELIRPERFSNPALIANIMREGIHL